ncbi:helix-turn-helix domain-containing protein [Kribbella sp. HUAS MG21]|uniref:Helix-turn-helix domain-containing protein n=1 Tax=Kribbella sp. HUAS MG21 TaxID=3160966 RepID=A0AAU7T9W4_9ACTN
MKPMLFESRDLGKTEEFLNRAYTKMQIGGGPSEVRTRISRATAASISVDRLEIGFEMSYDANPLGKICLCEVYSGTIADHATDGWRDEFGPGDLVSFAPPDQPFAGTVQRSTYSITMLDPALLTQVAGVSRKRNAPVRLRAHRPHSRDAARQLSRTIAYLGDHALQDPVVRSSPLMLSSLAQLLASSVLAAFPNTTMDEPEGAAARPVTIRRAVAYMESHLDQAIGVADIAEAADVTVRALQSAFQRHLGSTPLAYLRQLRLAEVRAELLAADPADTTVVAVAARWGFHHHGRMTAAYRELYGELPSATLARD